MSSKFIKDKSLHSAFRDARAETFLPRAPDLPLPSFIKRRSEGGMSEASPNSAGPSWVSSPFVEPCVDSTQQTSPPVSPLRLSRDSHVLEIRPENPNTSRRISLPRGVPYVPQSLSPRIEIPRHWSLQPAPRSPITSSLEDSGLHLRYHHPIGSSSQSFSHASPPSTSPPKLPSSPISSRDRNSDRGLSHGRVPPIPLPPIEIPCSWPQRSFPNSPRTSSSDESDFHPRYHHMVQKRGSMSPGRRRATPPRTSPPDVPLPPIPSDEQDSDSNSGMPKQSLPPKQPPTPVQCTFLHPSTPSRPLPIQPIPSPVPGSDESGNTDAIGGNSLRQHWQGSTGELLLDDVVRQDSPVYVLRDDHASQTGIGAPPPYVDQFDTYSAPDMPTIGEELDRAVSVCGGSPEVRLEVSRCIGFHRGYEPPYWQTRLQASGLNAEAAKYLVDEMSNHVDWAASFGRAI